MLKKSKADFDKRLGRTTPPARNGAEALPLAMAKEWDWKAIPAALFPLKLSQLCEAGWTAAGH